MGTSSYTESNFRLRATAEAIGEKNEQRFAYPVYATFPVLPLALLNFRAANRIAFCLIAALLVLSVGWIRENGTE